MGTVSKCLYIVSFLFSSLTVSAQGPEKDLAHEIYIRSGLEEQLRQLPFAIHAGFFQAVNQDNQSLRIPIPREVYLSIERLIAESFAAENIKEIVLGEIETQMSIDEMRRLLNWLDSPFGKKCTQLEKAASTPDAEAVIQKYSIYLQKFPPSPSLLKRMQELESASKTTENIIEIGLNTQLAIITALAKSFPTVEKRSIPEIMEEIEKHRPQFEAEAYQQVINRFLYTYRFLSNSELEQYIEFSKSNIGIKYEDSIYTGLNKALIDGSTKLGYSIEDVYKDVEY